MRLPHTLVVMEPAANYRERRAQAVKIVRSGDPRAIVELLDAPGAALRGYAAGTILRKGITSAVPALCRRVLEEPDSEARASMALALAELATTSDSSEVLRALLHDSEENVRRPALRGLSLTGDDSVIGAAILMYESARGWFAKQEALDALARLEAEQAHEALEKLFTAERRWWWRRRIRRALKGEPVRGHS